jgi:hypothetical protein
MNSNMHLETILWLDKQVDDINAKSTLIGELLMGETDRQIIKKYDNKLKELENELLGINSKIQMEKRLLEQEL